MVVICVLFDFYVLFNELNFIFYFLFVLELYFEIINIKWFLFLVLFEEDLYVYKYVYVYIRILKCFLKGIYVDV